MSDNVKNTQFDVLVDLNLSKVKPKLRRKILKQLDKEKFQIEINVDVYSNNEGLIDVLTDAVVTLKNKKRKKTKKK